MSFPRYPKYKPSGVEWLGEVPEDWMLPAVGHRYEVALGKMLDGKRITGEHLAPYLRNADVQWGQIRVDDLPEMDFEPADRDRYALRHGDLLVCEGGEVGRCAIWHSLLGECYYQKALHRLRPLSTETDYVPYMRWLLEAAADRGCFSAGESKATIAHLPAEALRRTRIPCPGLSEQRAIAAFLDRETAKIDALIAEQEKLIELLAEKRQAVISHAVTKGLNPAAPMKPSGVEWLGEVPAHWGIVRLAGLFRDVAEEGNDGLQILSVSIHDGVSDKEMSESELDRKVTRSEDRSKYVKVQPGDLVYNMMRAWQGAFGTVQTVGMVSPAYVVARPKSDAPTEFFERVLRTPNAVEQMRRYSQGVTDFRLRLYWDEFKNLRVPCPPAAEIKALLDHVGQIELTASSIEAEALQLIDLLRERRSALISAAVTGQIDVRNATPEHAA